MAAPPAPPDKPPPPVPNNYLGASPRQAIITAAYIAANAPVSVSLYGSGPTRSLVWLSAGVVAYKPSSPAYDPAVDGVGSDVITTPTLPLGSAIGVSAKSIEAGTTADVLVLF